MGSSQAVWNICAGCLIMAVQEQGCHGVFLYTATLYIRSAWGLVCCYCRQSLCVLWLCIPSIVIPGMVLLSMTGFPGKVSKLSKLWYICLAAICPTHSVRFQSLSRHRVTTSPALELGAWQIQLFEKVKDITMLWTNKMGARKRSKLNK